MSKHTRRTLLKAGLGATLSAGLTAPIWTGQEKMALAATLDAPTMEPLKLDAAAMPALRETVPFHLGTARAADGRTLTADTESLLLNGEPFLPVMGEFHYTRYPETEWRRELLKMKAGGIDIVSTYVFWIHHEEMEGQFDWNGRRSLRKFIDACQSAGLMTVVRLGPWCHGEVRNGGLPDWTLAKGYKTRSLDPVFIADVRKLYTEIAAQLAGHLWKDGGPVIGVQVDNEYHGPAEYLLALKAMARDVGLDTPIYTRTGWPELTTPITPGELLPLSGAYPDGFWDRTLDFMPGGYASAYRFSLMRNATAATIGTDQNAATARPATEHETAYPYFCCELGGGMETSYHRRIQIAPRDIESLALVKVGSGNNLQGYYMYHGGTNPDGKLSTLEESQASKYPNDMPVKSYDFQAPLGEFGQLRAHYHWLRRMHLFLRDWGGILARMPAHAPQILPANSHDAAALRWSARTDGKSGFVFVSNYQRGLPMPDKTNVQLELNLMKGRQRLPAQPCTVKAGEAFFWPFNLALHGATLVHATAQPVCCLEEGADYYAVFAQTPGIPTEFVFAAENMHVQHASGNVTHEGNNVYIRDVRAGTGAALHLQTAGSKNLYVVLLDDAQSLTCWKETLAGRARLFLTRAGLTADGSSLTLCSEKPADLTVAILPAPKSVRLGARAVHGTADGLFQTFALPPAPMPAQKVTLTALRTAGPAREIPLGHGKVAQAPTDADWKSAAAWRVTLPQEIGPKQDLLLRVRYAGDAARFTLDGKLLCDNFYNGNAFDLGLTRYAPEITTGELVLEILPLRRAAPVYLSEQATAKRGNAETTLILEGVDVVEQHTAQAVCT